MDNKTAWWTWVIYNSICVICFTALAIVFNKWGIALFALLFMSTLETQARPAKVYYRICDKCGKHSEYATTYDEAIKKAKESGWIIRRVRDKWDDRCPDCQELNGD